MCCRRSDRKFQARSTACGLFMAAAAQALVFVAGLPRQDLRVACSASVRSVVPQDAHGFDTERGSVGGKNPAPQLLDHSAVLRGIGDRRIGRSWFSSQSITHEPRLSPSGTNSLKNFRRPCWICGSEWTAISSVSAPLGMNPYPRQFDRADGRHIRTRQACRRTLEQRMARR